MFHAPSRRWEARSVAAKKKSAAKKVKVKDLKPKKNPKGGRKETNPHFG